MIHNLNRGPKNQQLSRVSMPAPTHHTLPPSSYSLLMRVWSCSNQRHRLCTRMSELHAYAVISSYSCSVIIDMRRSLHSTHLQRSRYRPLLQLLQAATYMPASTAGSLHHDRSSRRIETLLHARLDINFPPDIIDCTPARHAYAPVVLRYSLTRW